MNGLRLAYAGTPEFAVAGLQALLHSEHQVELVITQPDRRAGRGRKLTPSPVKVLASKAQIPILQPEDINHAKCLAQLADLRLDALIVAAFGQLFKASLLQLPSLGCLNIHASLLPRWRGASPIQHAILAGDPQTGVSIMQMERRMDAGDVWVQRSCDISAQDSAQTLHAKLAALSGQALLDALLLLSTGDGTAQPQNDALATYCTKLSKKDGQIDWYESTQQIVRKIRAFYPWPGAYTVFGDRRLVITGAVEEVLETPTSEQPGTVIDSNKQGILVVTGDQALRIQELIPAGGKSMAAASFANSNPMERAVLGEEQ